MAVLCGKCWGKMERIRHPLHRRILLVRLPEREADAEKRYSCKDRPDIVKQRLHEIRYITRSEVTSKSTECGDEPTQNDTENQDPIALHENSLVSLLLKRQIR